MMRKTTAKRLADLAYRQQYDVARCKHDAHKPMVEEM